MQLTQIQPLIFRGMGGQGIGVGVAGGVPDSKNEGYAYTRSRIIIPPYPPYPLSPL